MQRLRLGRSPRVGGWTVVEAALLALIAFQCARFFWTLVTPLGPVGDWRPGGAEAAPASAQVLAAFDPFFRLSAPGGPVTVTALSLKLHGVRQDQASGRGSAIIATPDGRQRSYGVGDEIVPGVKLQAVAFDHVTLSRGGTTEQLFMDQSGEAKVVAPAMPPPALPLAPPPAPVAVPREGGR